MRCDYSPAMDMGVLTVNLFCTSIRNFYNQITSNVSTESVPSQQTHDHTTNAKILNQSMILVLFRKYIKQAQNKIIMFINCHDLRVTIAGVWVGE
jgi:hypothetical protein